MFIWHGKQKPAKHRSLHFSQYEVAFEVYAAGVGALFVVGQFGDALCHVFAQLAHLDEAFPVGVGVLVALEGLEHGDGEEAVLLLEAGRCILRPERYQGKSRPSLFNFIRSRKNSSSSIVRISSALALAFASFSFALAAPDLPSLKSIAAATT